MKKVILSMLILVLSLSLFMGVATVYAEEAYQKDDLLMITDRVTFSDPNKATISDLVLPTGYWVKYVRAEGAGHIVSYNGVELFVSSEHIKAMEKVDTEKYELPSKPQYNVDTPICLDSNEDSMMLFATKECVKENKLLTIENSDPLIFLNTMTNSSNTLVYLVATSDKKIGFVKARYTNQKSINSIPSAPTLVEKPIEVPDEPVIPDTGGGDNITDESIPVVPDDKVEPTKGNVVKVTLIVAICILAAVLVFLIFKPTRTNKGRYKVDSYDDYERDDEYQDRY